MDDFMVLGTNDINPEPQSLYSFTHTPQEILKCPRRKVIKSFCFPNDLSSVNLSSLEQLETYLPSPEQDPYMFIYTLNGEDTPCNKIKPTQNQQEQDMKMPEDPMQQDLTTFNPDNLMYIYCLRFNTIVSSEPIHEQTVDKKQILEMIKRKQLHVTERSFSILFSSNCFFKL